MLKSKTIKEKIEKLKYELKEQEERERKEEQDRKNDTKIKVLLGAYIKSDSRRFDKIVSEESFEKFLIRDAERKLFGFEVLTQKEKEERESLKSKFKSNAISTEKDDTPKKHDIEPNFSEEHLNRIYLDSVIDDRDAIVQICTSIFGTNSRGLDWDFDKNKKKWWVLRDKGMDLNPLEKWFPEEIKIST
jgi:HD superfamily phosphohydrolase